MTKMRFTLDMNCFMAVEKDQVDLQFVLELVSLHGKGGINIAIPSSIGASELPKK